MTELRFRTGKEMMQYLKLEQEMAKALEADIKEHKVEGELLPESARYISEEEANRIHAGADLSDDSFDYSHCGNCEYMYPDEGDKADCSCLSELPSYCPMNNKQLKVVSEK